MPNSNYVLDGTIRVNSLIKGYAEIEHTTDTSNHGVENLDLYIGGGTTTEVVTVNIKNVTQDETIQISTGNDGVYNFDCANFSVFEDKDELLIWVKTSSTRDTDVFEEPRIVSKNTYHKEAKAIKNILVNRKGNEYHKDNPLPVVPVTEDFTGLNYSMVWTHDSSGRLITETRTYKGKSIRRTWTFTGNNYNSDGHSGWVEI